MADGALVLFESLTGYDDFEELIAGGEAEGLHLECKAPAEPRLARDLKVQLAKAISGFSNTAGGVVVWGVSTTPHQHSGLDVLTQLEPIGQCNRLAQQIQNAIPTLTTPAVFDTQVRQVRRRPRDTKGIVLAYIPTYRGDPVQSNLDEWFWFRTGDEFRKAPHEMIKRLFAASDSPDIWPLLYANQANMDKDGTWTIPMGCQNRSSAIGEHVTIHVQIRNPSSCETIGAQGFKDLSPLNPGQTVYGTTLNGVVHRGLHMQVGGLKLQMAVKQRPKRALKLRVLVWANKMRAREVELSLQLTKQHGLRLTASSERFLY